MQSLLSYDDLILVCNLCLICMKVRWEFYDRRKFHGESNVWSTAQIKRSMDLVLVGFQRNHRSVGYCKQCLLVWSCVEERGWSCLGKSIRF